MTKFPSVEFFLACQEALSKHPESVEGVPPSEAYCGFSIGGQLFVLEFDGHACAAVVAGGNPIDLDFVIAGPLDVWRRTFAERFATSLADLIGAGDLVIESEEEEGAARAALPMLQALLDRARDFEFELA